jgi:hypothetical protein
VQGDGFVGRQPGSQAEDTYNLRVVACGYYRAAAHRVADQYDPLDPLGQPVQHSSQIRRRVCIRAVPAAVSVAHQADGCVRCSIASSRREGPHPQDRCPPAMRIAERVDVTTMSQQHKIRGGGRRCDEIDPRSAH